MIQLTAEMLAKLPVIAARTWETRKDQIAQDAKLLSRRLEDQKALNLKAIKAKLNGELSAADYDTLKQSIDEETKSIEHAIASLDAEKSSYAEIMQETQFEAVDFVKAWKDGNVHRKREIQSALFPEGLPYER